MDKENTDSALDLAVNKVSDGFKKVENSVSEMGTKVSNIENKINEVEANLNRISKVKDLTDKDPKRGFSNHIEFFKSVIDASQMTFENMPENMKRIFNTVGSDEARISSNPAGGFLIPPTFLTELLKTDSSELQVNSGAFTRKIPMNSQIVYLNARVDKNHTNSVSGGFRVYRRSETSTVEASKSDYEQIKLEAKSLMGIGYASEEILATSPVSFAALIQDGFGDELISKLNYERLWGTGIGEYLGIYKSDAKIEIAKESNQTADTIVGSNILKMRSRAYRYGQCVWMANQDTLLQLMSTHIAGTNGDVFLFAPGNGVDKPDTLLGRPILLDENCATLGDAGDIALVNWNEYLEGTRGGMNFMDSIHVRFVYNERAFRFTAANDGAPWWSSALKPKNSASTLSPFVTLAAR
jgi:HK97 family phage major capsid protein